MLYVLGIAAFVLWVVSIFVVLFTERNPFLGFQTMYLRYYWRVASFGGFMRNEYPPFDFATDPALVVPDAAVVEVEDPGEMNRWLPLVKWLPAFPHYVVLWLLEIAVFVVLVIQFFVVLFTGRWNDAMREFVVGVARWYTRVHAYVFLLTDKYPTVQPAVKRGSSLQRGDGLAGQRSVEVCPRDQRDPGREDHADDEHD